MTSVAAEAPSTGALLQIAIFGKLTAVALPSAPTTTPFYATPQQEPVPQSKSALEQKYPAGGSSA